jgi:PAS domain S-box-containing protein
MDELRPEWIEQVEGILQSLNQGVIIVDDCPRIVFANSIFLEMIGLPPEDLLGMGPETFFPPEDVPRLMEHRLRGQNEGHNRFEFYLPHSKGGRVPVVISAQQIEDPDGRTFAVVTFTDISEQKHTQLKLSEANSLLEERQSEIEEELQLAARVQESLAPKSLAWDGVRVETFYHAARTIGGDYGLVVPGDDWLTLLVCDVSGHGIGSALVANRLYTETVSQIESGAEPGPMLRHLNRFVMQSLAGSAFYLTLALARIKRDARTIEFASAGHPPVMIARRGQATRMLESGSMVIGLFENAIGADPTIEIPVQPGDRLVMYTDGFTENFDARGQMLGVAGLAKLVEESSALPLAEMKQSILEGVAAWRVGPAADDMSLILAEIT